MITPLLAVQGWNIIDTIAQESPKESSVLTTTTGKEISKRKLKRQLQQEWQAQKQITALLEGRTQDLTKKAVKNTLKRDNEETKKQVNINEQIQNRNKKKNRLKGKDEFKDNKGIQSHVVHELQVNNPAKSSLTKARINNSKSKKNNHYEANSTILISTQADKTKSNNNNDKQKTRTKDHSTTKDTEEEKKLTPFQLKMQQKLKGAHFRWLNQLLYSIPSNEAIDKFKNNVEYFEAYHQGFQNQVKSWPLNPVDVYIQQINDPKIVPPGSIIADMGCGEALIAKNSPTNITVHSFDLVAANPYTHACDISNTPLKLSSVDITIFCLALMGTNYHEFIIEAHRILKSGGILKIAEVVSRLSNVDQFISYIEILGFKLKTKDTQNKMFLFLEFIKLNNSSSNVNSSKEHKRPKFCTSSTAAAKNNSNLFTKMGPPVLKPCIYKRR